jgi:hypothetical protein
LTRLLQSSLGKFFFSPVSFFFQEATGIIHVTITLVCSY